MNGSIKRVRSKEGRRWGKRGSLWEIYVHVFTSESHKASTNRLFFTLFRRTEDIFIRNFHNTLAIIHINNCIFIIVIINMTAESFFARNMPTFLLGAAFLVTYWSLPQGIPLPLPPHS
jgi:hypothetical protein